MAVMMLVMVVFLAMGGPGGHMGISGGMGATQSSQPYDRDTVKPN